MKRFHLFLLSWALTQLLPAQNRGFENPLATSQYFNFLVGQTQFIIQEIPDSIPIKKNRSGTFSLGIGVDKEILPNRLGIRLAPSIAWTKIQYEQTPQKVFPTANPNLKKERHLITYLQLPIGFFIPLTKPDQQNHSLYIEAGGYGSWKIQSSYKSIQQTTRDQTIINKIKNLPDLNEFQYGLYGKFGYKWFALQVTYRFTNTFTEFQSDQNNDPTSFKNPTIPPIEVGIILVL